MKDININDPHFYYLNHFEIKNKNCQSTYYNYKQERQKDSQTSNENVFALQHLNQFRALTQQLYNETKLHVINIGRMFMDGSFSAVSDNKSWVTHFLQKYLSKEYINPRLKTGINYWKRYTNEHLSEMAEDARNNFEIDARIDFVFYNRQEDYYQVYSFCADHKYADKAYDFYGQHRGKLLKFIGHFNYMAAPLMHESFKPENRIYIPDYIAPELKEAKRDYYQELQAENASVELTDREFEVLILYGNGCSQKQIAEMFHKSYRTIKSHLKTMRYKLGLQTKMDFHRYLLDNNLDGLERFFFDYIPEEKEIAQLK